MRQSRTKSRVTVKTKSALARYILLEEGVDRRHRDVGPALAQCRAPALDVVLVEEVGHLRAEAARLRQHGGGDAPRRPPQQVPDERAADAEAQHQELARCRDDPSGRDGRRCRRPTAGRSRAGPVDWPPLALRRSAAMTRYSPLNSSNGLNGWSSPGPRPSSSARRRGSPAAESPSRPLRNGCEHRLFHRTAWQSLLPRSDIGSIRSELALLGGGGHGLRCCHRSICPQEGADVAHRQRDLVRACPSTDRGSPARSARDARSPSRRHTGDPARRPAIPGSASGSCARNRASRCTRNRRGRRYMLVRNASTIAIVMSGRRAHSSGPQPFMLLL